MTAYTTTVQRRAAPKTTGLAIQYKELSRRPGKYADIVERNFHHIAPLFGKVVVRECTLPNGTKEGKPIVMTRLPEGKIILNLGDWLVLENKTFKVYNPADFESTFTTL